MELNRTIKLFLPIALFLGGPTFAADLKVTDNTNTVVLVRDAVVDYGAFTSDKEEEGIRLQQGDATVLAEWAKIANLTVTGIDASATPPRIKVEVVAKNGSKMSGVLVRKGRMKLVGRTDLGDYSIDLEKVRAIVPIQ